MRKLLLAACICILPPLVSFASAQAVDEIFKAIVGEIVRNTDRNQQSTSRQQWLVIASRDDADAAIDVASTYTPVFGNIKVAKTTNGRFAVIAGYLQERKSKANQESLRSLKIIPIDSYTVNSERILQIVWQSNYRGEEREIVHQEQFREFIRRLQSVLAAAGFYSGEVDGAIGPQTSKAFSVYLDTRRVQLDRLDNTALSEIEDNVRGEGGLVGDGETQHPDAEPDQVNQRGWFNLEEHASETPYYDLLKSCWRSDNNGNPDQSGIMRCVNAKPNLTTKDRALAKYDLEKVTGDAWVKYLAEEQAVDLSQFVNACWSGGDITRAIICIRSDENLSDLQKDKTVALARERSATEEKQALARLEMERRERAEAERRAEETDATRDYSFNVDACWAQDVDSILSCLDQDRDLTPGQKEYAKKQARTKVRSGQSDREKSNLPVEETDIAENAGSIPKPEEPSVANEDTLGEDAAYFEFLDYLVNKEERMSQTIRQCAFGGDIVNELLQIPENNLVYIPPMDLRQPIEEELESLAANASTKTEARKWDQRKQYLKEEVYRQNVLLHCAESALLSLFESKYFSNESDSVYPKLLSFEGVETRWSYSSSDLKRFREVYDDVTDIGRKDAMSRFASFIFNFTSQGQKPEWDKFPDFSKFSALNFLSEISEWSDITSESTLSRFDSSRVNRSFDNGDGPTQYELGISRLCGDPRCELGGTAQVRWALLRDVMRSYLKRVLHVDM